MADVYVNALTQISTEPTTTDSVVCVNRNTNEGQIIDYNLLADVILNKITSKTYSSLTTSSKLLTGAVNELDADIVSLRDDALTQARSWSNNANIDNYTTIGSYMIGSSPTNGPVSTTGAQEDWYVLLVVGTSNLAFRQIALTRRGYIAVRDYSSGSFQSWVKYASSSSMVTSIVVPSITVANGYGQASVSCAKTGLKAIGVAGWSLGSSWYMCTIANVNVANQTLTVEVRNVSNASASGTATPNIYVLYIPG